MYQIRTSERLELEEEDPPVVKVTNIDNLEITYNIIYLKHVTISSSTDSAEQHFRSMIAPQNNIMHDYVASQVG